MPKTIAITPSWYWPEAIERISGVPPFGVTELCLGRHVRENPDGLALVAEGRNYTYSELYQQVCALALALNAKGVGKFSMDGRLTADNIVKLLAVLSACIHTRIISEDEDYDGASSLFGSGMDLRDELVDESVQGVEAGDYRMLADSSRLAEAVIAIPGRNSVVNHSNRSLLAAAISLETFLQPEVDRPWLATLPIDRWEGLLSVLCPLFIGAPLILAQTSDTDEFARMICEHQPGYTLTDFSHAALATRESKKEVKKTREILNAILLTTDGIFDSGDRQRISKSFRCPALTVFGLAETSAIFASHPLWYMDESVGIPMTNAHVVPADPRSGAPVQTLWELVESAEVTVQGPSLMCGYEGGDNEQPFLNGRFRTGVIASSDANGMIYVLPD